jgi:uncharacterized heparinase superfamily protein
MGPRVKPRVFVASRLRRARLYTHALRAARPRQLRARAVRPLTRRRTRAGIAPGRLRPLEPLAAWWSSQAFAGADEVAAGLAEGAVSILGLTVEYPPHGWDKPGLERLRRFHLHYGDEVLGAVRSGDAAALRAARAGIDAWIEAARDGQGDAWHPYPVSTRILNWVAAATLAPELASPQMSESAWRQLVFLSRNVEDDLLGNHVIRNAAALAVGGSAFGALAMREQARALLRRELPEQVLDDGGHYERSPVYHDVVLRDLLTVEPLLVDEEVTSAIGRMKRFSASVRRPDGHAPLFNDGGLDIAPDLQDVLPLAEDGLTLLPASGYAVVRFGDDLWLMFDCGPASPPYLPAHAHGDGLSFELWFDGRPLVVDPGTYTYEPGVDRTWFRSTRAHSTVTIDGRDQVESWAAFRAGPLAAVEPVEASGNEAEGSVVGRVYRVPGLPPSLEVTRRLSWSREAITAEDRIGGFGRRHVQCVLQLAPGQEPDGIEWRGSLEPVAEKRRVSERFFERREAQAVVASAQVDLPATGGWTIRRGAR